MAISSLYEVPAFANDKLEVVMARIEQHPKMKLVTCKQDFDLHRKLARWGIKDDQSLNLYDWLQGALDYPMQGHDYDYRVFPRYDKRSMILSPENDKNGGYLALRHDGRTFARLDYQHDAIQRTQTVKYYGQKRNVWAKDIYDTRGFLSRRQYFNPDGKLGMELVYHVDGTPVLEISHMGKATMYRLLGTHGLPNWLLANELSLMLWWYGQILNDGETVYNDDPVLDPVWTQLADKINLVEVAHAIDLSQQRISDLHNRKNVKSPSRSVAQSYRYEFLNPWNPIKKVKLNKHYDHDKVAMAGRWFTNDQVDELLEIIDGVHQARSMAKFELFGYFTTDTQKYYDEQVEKKGLDSVITVRGNMVGPQRTRLWQDCCVAVVVGSILDSDVVARRLNNDGVPVVTDLPGLHGAHVSQNQPKLFVQGVLMGFRQHKAWHEYIKQHVVDAITEPQAKLSQKQVQKAMKKTH